MANGKTRWVIPDGYIPLTSSGELVSHESICVLNLNKDKVTLTINAYFEDREPILNIISEVSGLRTKHIRTSLLESQGVQIPAGIPYAMEVISNKPVFVQYSRLDSTQAENALMSVMAYPVEKD